MLRRASSAVLGRLSGFMKWPRVLAGAGRFDEESRPLRYNYAGPHGANPAWFFLNQMFYNPGEVEKVLAASDVVIINYGLHYCQPSRPGADARCHQQFARYESEMAELLARLNVWVAASGRRRRVAILQETSAQHFAPVAGGSATGDWELRHFFPHLGATPCNCTPSGAQALPLRTQLVRNLTVRYPRVRLLRVHDLLHRRFGWHQQDCKGRVLARRRRTTGLLGCDCTHYCFSPAFNRRYWWELKQHLLASD